MERGSSKHSPHVDDELAREARSYLQGGAAGSRVDEWRDPELIDDLDPDAQWLPDGARPDGAPAPLTGEILEARSRLGRSIPRSALPGNRHTLIRGAQEMKAPPDVLAALERLPADRTYQTVYEIWDALGFRNEEGTH